KFKAIGQGVFDAVKIPLGKLQGLASRIGLKIPEPIQKGFQMMVSGARTAFSTLLSISGNGIKGYIGAFKSANQAIKNGIGFVADAIGNKLSNGFSKLSIAANKAATYLPGPFKTAASNIANIFNDLAVKTDSLSGRMANAIRNGGIVPAFNYVSQ
ncbi:hypothetical protein, partial [Enterococcus faecalis]